MTLPFERISKEMRFRGLYPYLTAFNKGMATDRVPAFADPVKQDLGIVKMVRSKPPLLDLASLRV